jgi:hypothetical protein
MHEEVLADFFLGRSTAEQLARDLEGSRRKLSEVHTVTEIKDMANRFLVTRAMAVALCDAVLDGHLPPSDLETIGFTLVASNNFYWSEVDGEPAETFYDWSCPQINYPLTMDTVRMFRARLTEGEDA